MRFCCNSKIYCVTFFAVWTISFFVCLTSTKAYRHWISCERTSSYNFSWIFIKLCRCFCHGLQMCMRLGCNSQIIFVTFSTVWTWSFFGLASSKSYRHWVSCERNSSYSFTRIFLKLCMCFFKVWRCAWGLAVILRLFLSLFLQS